MSAVPVEPPSAPDPADLALEHLLVVERRDPEAPYPRSGLPCPTWCEQPHGHPFDSLDLHPTDGAQDCPARFHVETLHWTEDGAVVAVQAVEALRPTRLVHHPVQVLLEAQVCSLTPAEAREVAQQLVAAAVRAEQLQDSAGAA